MHPYTFDNANTVGQNVGHLDKGGEWKGISFQQVRLLAAGDVGSIKRLCLLYLLCTMSGKWKSNREMRKHSL